MKPDEAATFPKIGDIREDGRRLCGWSKYKNKRYPIWVLPAKIKAGAAARRERDRKDPQKVEQARAYQNAYRKKNIEKSRAQGRAKYKRNRAHIIEKKKAWRDSNREKLHEIQRNWRLRNLHKDSEKAMRRHAKKNGRSTFNDPTMRSIYESCSRVSKCSGIRFNVDHWIPLSRRGAHRSSNLVVLPKAINISKGNKLIEKFPDNLSAILKSICPHMLP